MTPAEVISESWVDLKDIYVPQQAAATILTLISHAGYEIRPAVDPCIIPADEARGRWQREAVSARVRHDGAAERRALDMLHLLDRQESAE